MPLMGQRPQMQRYLEEHEVNTAAPDSGFVGAWGGVLQMEIPKMDVIQWNTLLKKDGSGVPPL